MNTQQTLAIAAYRAEIMNDETALMAAILTIGGKQTEHERKIRDTVDKNLVGFTAYHASYGTLCYNWVLAGNKLTEPHKTKIARIMCKYGRQIALKPEIAKIYRANITKLQRQFAQQ